MRGLTDRQEQILEYIVESIKERLYPPSYREIGDRVGISSTNAVSDHLRALKRKGYIDFDKAKRGIVLTTKSRQIYDVFFHNRIQGDADVISRYNSLIREMATGILSTEEHEINRAVEIAQLLSDLNHEEEMSIVDDIAKCTGEGCLAKNECYRQVVKPLKRNTMMMSPVKNQYGENCRHFMKLEMKGKVG